MSSQIAVHVRFPSGFSEISYATEAPKVGDTLKRGKDEWRVIAVETAHNGSTVVTLGPVEPSGNGTVAHDI